MKAITQHRYGTTSNVLELATLDEPTIGDDQVLLQVHAAGLDMGVWHLMTGLPYMIRPMFGLRSPKQQVPGSDVAGRIAAVGANVRGFAVGDEVFGTADGSFAEFAVTTPDRITRTPSNIDPSQAATVATSGAAALQALRDKGNVTAGDRVLVIGASGGVGSFAVQLAKAFGAQVTGVASAAKVDLVRSLGADEVIDYTRGDIDDGGERWDLIVDIAGTRPLRQLRRALTERGTLVFLGGEGGGRIIGGTGTWARGLVLAPFVRQRIVVLSSKAGAEDLQVLAELIAAGDVTPTVDRTYPLAHTGAAIDDLRSGTIRGKAAIAP
jgi:NADPH:quinone reductase-like Zn-dependent oxidoreductase